MSTSQEVSRSVVVASALGMIAVACMLLASLGLSTSSVAIRNDEELGKLRGQYGFQYDLPGHKKEGFHGSLAIVLRNPWG